MEKNMQQVTKYLTDSFNALKQGDQEKTERLLHYATTEGEKFSTKDEYSRFAECLKIYNERISENQILDTWHFTKGLRSKNLETIAKYNEKATQKTHLILTEEYEIPKEEYSMIPSQIQNFEGPTLSKKSIKKVRKIIQGKSPNGELKKVVMDEINFWKSIPSKIKQGIIKGLEANGKYMSQTPYFPHM